MTDPEKIIELRNALKLALHRLEALNKYNRDRGMNCNPNDKVIVQAYAALRNSQPAYDSIPASHR